MFAVLSIVFVTNAKAATACTDTQNCAFGKSGENSLTCISQDTPQCQGNIFACVQNASAADESSPCRCNIGYYQENVNATECTPCPPGTTTTSNEGASTATAGYCAFDNGVDGDVSGYGCVASDNTEFTYQVCKYIGSNTAGWCTENPTKCTRFLDINNSMHLNTILAPKEKLIP